MREVLRLGTRTTPLARWQADHVAGHLTRAWPALEVQLVPFVTEGDRRLAQPLPEIGGKGVFTAELEAALHERRIDLAVHSLKDLPVAQPDGLTLGAILPREDPRDAWVSPTGIAPAGLPPGAVVGTSSLRRRAQLLARTPQLDVQPIRGSVETRLRKVREGSYAATVLAMAGLRRLGLEDVITSVFGFDVMLPAPGQAALAVQCRTDDEMLQVLSSIDHEPSRLATTAERAFLQALGGGCSAPIGAYVRVQGRELHLQGTVLAVDGSHRIDVQASGTVPELVGEAAAARALSQGAAEVIHA